MAIEGMDPAAVRDAARRMDARAQRIRQHRARLNSLIRSTPWPGPAGAQFRALWEMGPRPSLTRSAAYFDDVAHQLRRNASQQEATSAARSGRLRRPVFPPGHLPLAIWIVRVRRFLPRLRWYDVRGRGDRGAGRPRRVPGMLLWQQLVPSRRLLRMPVFAMRPVLRRPDVSDSVTTRILGLRSRVADSFWPMRYLQPQLITPHPVQLPTAAVRDAVMGISALYVR